MSLASPGESTLVVRMEATLEEGRIAASEGLVNPVFMNLAPRSQRVFLAEGVPAAAIRLRGHRSLSPFSVVSCSTQRLATAFPEGREHHALFFD